MYPARLLFSRTVIAAGIALCATMAQAGFAEVIPFDEVVATAWRIPGLFAHATGRLVSLLYLVRHTSWSAARIRGGEGGDGGEADDFAFGREFPYSSHDARRVPSE